jgi:hypothetical protein
MVENRVVGGELAERERRRCMRRGGQWVASWVYGRQEDEGGVCIGEAGREEEERGRGEREREREVEG